MAVTMAAFLQCAKGNFDGDMTKNCAVAEGGALGIGSKNHREVVNRGEETTEPPIATERTNEIFTDISVIPVAISASVVKFVTSHPKQTLTSRACLEGSMDQKQPMGSAAPSSRMGLSWASRLKPALLFHVEHMRAIGA